MTEKRRAWLIVGLLFLFMTLNFSDKAIVGLAEVPLMKEMGLTARQFGLVGSSFFFLFSISAVIGGFVANRVQTRSPPRTRMIPAHLQRFSPRITFSIPGAARRVSRPRSPISKISAGPGRIFSFASKTGCSPVTRGG
jgi:MFS family permease